MATDSLGPVLKQARLERGLSLRDVERAKGIKSGHLSQLETGRIVKPEMALLWDLATLYGLDFAELLTLAGHGSFSDAGSERRQRMTVAVRALGELTAAEQQDVLRYIGELKHRRESDAPR